MKKNGELSLEQLRQKLHISKRKAAWMLQNGVIPCRIVDTPTLLRYYVKEEDLREYITNLKASVQEKSPSESSPPVTKMHRRLKKPAVQK